MYLQFPSSFGVVITNVQQQRSLDMVCGEECGWLTDTDGFFYDTDCVKKAN